YREAVLVTPKLRFWARGSKIVPGVQDFIPQELKDCSMKIVAARFGTDHYGAAVRSPIFRRIRVDVEPEFRNAINHRVEGYLSRLGLQDTDAVIEVFVGA